MNDLTTTLLGVAAIWSIAAVTPGPNFFITMHAGLKHSQTVAIFVVLGIVLGTITWGIAGFMGITLLFATAPWAYLLLKLLGGLYLIYLGVRLFITSSSKKNGNRGDLQHYPTISLIAATRLGLLTNLANPKTALFVASLFASTMPQQPSFITGITSIFLMAVISFSWYGSVAFICSTDQVTNYLKRSWQWIDRISGTIFIGFGLKLASDR